MDGLFTEHGPRIYEIKGKKFILAIPPLNISKFLSKSRNLELKNPFGELKDFSSLTRKTNYLEYIPVIFHFDKKIKLENIWEFPSTFWGVVHIVLSDYMKFNDQRSKTVISTLINKKSKSEYKIKKI